MIHVEVQVGENFFICCIDSDRDASQLVKLKVLLHSPLSQVREVLLQAAEVQVLSVVYVSEVTVLLVGVKRSHIVATAIRLLDCYFEIILEFFVY